MPRLPEHPAGRPPEPLRNGNTGGVPRLSLLFELFVVNSGVRTLLGRTMADAGLRPDEYALYSAVVVAQPVSVTDLCRSVGMPLTTVSDYVRTMTARGHVARTPNPADSRSVLLSLTPSGRAAHTRARASFDDTMARISAALTVPPAEVSRALTALDEAVRAVAADLDAGPVRRRR